MSKKQLKKMTRMSVAELKTVVVRPDLVEMHDVTAPDPKLLLALKATRNTVPVSVVSLVLACVISTIYFSEFKTCFT